MKALETFQAALEAGYLREYKGLIEAEVLNRDFIWRSANRSLERSTLNLYQGYYRQNLDAHLWHEDRTSAAHSIESRVPFLDHRLLEFLSSIPTEHHAALFVDKKILRRAVADLLPAEIANRPKGYFYFGEEQRHTFHLMYSLLIANNRELIERAIAGSTKNDGPINVSKIHDYVSETGRDPEYAELPRLLTLINMGLLAEMATSLCVPTRNDRLPVSEIEKKGDGHLNGSQDPAANINKEKSTDNQVPALAPGATLFESPGTAGVKIDAPGKEQMTILSPGWETFLKSMDGKKTVIEIINLHSLSKSRTLKFLAKAIEDKLIILTGSKQQQEK